MISRDVADAARPARGASAGGWARAAVGLVATAVFVWLAFGTVDWREARRVVGSARVAWLLLAVATLGAGLSARLVRWWLMLRTVAPRLPLRACARPYLVSLALNNTLPMRAGDVMRVVAFGGTLRASPMRVFGTLLVERLLDLFVLVALFFVEVLMTPPAGVPRMLVAWAAAIGAATLLVLLLLVLAPDGLRALVGYALARPALARRTWAPRAMSGARQLLDTLALLRAPARASRLLALSIAAWLLEGAVFACVARALGTGGAPLAPWFASVTGTLATLIPSAPGYVGPYDYFVLRGLAAHGVEGAAAVAFALVVHLLIWLPVTLLGLALLAVTRSHGAHDAHGEPTLDAV